MVESLYIIPDAPRLALLSDLHGRPYQEAVFSLQRNKPDIICITGDIIYCMDMLGFLRLRAWDAQREAEKKKPRQRFIDEVWPRVKP